MKVQNILATKTRPVFTIRPDQLIRDAIKLLAVHDIGVLVVVEKGAEWPVGIISERDIVRFATMDEDVASRQVVEAMTSPVVTAVLQDDLYSVMHTMTEKKIRHLPVMDKDRLVGIISIGDVLKVQRDTYRGEVTNLEIHIMADD